MQYGAHVHLVDLDSCSPQLPSHSSNIRERNDRMAIPQAPLMRFDQALQYQLGTAGIEPDDDMSDSNHGPRSSIRPFQIAIAGLPLP